MSFQHANISVLLKDLFFFNKKLKQLIVNSYGKRSQDLKDIYHMQDSFIGVRKYMVK